MSPEAVLSRILPGVERLLKEVVARAMAPGTAPTLYELEALTQAVLARIGQVVLQEVVVAQGSGLVGPSRPCLCGAEQTYHDQRRRLVVKTSVGDLRLVRRAYYRCAACRATSSPLDEQLGLGQAGRMSRYLQEQCGWLLALLPGRLGQETLRRFGWPAVSASEVRAKGEALGAELEARAAVRLAALRAVAAHPTSPGAIRQPAQGSRLYAAPDGLRYCTTEREPTSRKLLWRELKVAAVYEVVPRARAEPSPAPERRPPPLRTRLRAYQAATTPSWTLAPVDQAVRITYVARTEAYAQFGAHLWAELRERGLGAPVTDLAVVADGSPHLDQVVDSELRLPGIQLTRILDLPHAQEHLWTVSKAVFGEGHPAALRWVQPALRALERGQADLLCQELTTLAQEHADQPAAADTARKAAAYFADRAPQLAYPTFLAQGYQVGSGLAESGCKRFGTDRMKGAGMRWSQSGAQDVATLRMLLLSDRWQEVADLCRGAA
ncbi:MAG TPA: ISKra4 family transposase [Chloroflexota bacterium]